MTRITNWSRYVGKISSVYWHHRRVGDMGKNIKKTIAKRTSQVEIFFKMYTHTRLLWKSEKQWRGNASFLLLKHNVQYLIFFAIIVWRMGHDPIIFFFFFVFCFIFVSFIIYIYISLLSSGLERKFRVCNSFTCRNVGRWWWMCAHDVWWAKEMPRIWKTGTPTLCPPIEKHPFKKKKKSPLLKIWAKQKRRKKHFSFRGKNNKNIDNITVRRSQTWHFLQMERKEKQNQKERERERETSREFVIKAYFFLLVL